MMKPRTGINMMVLFSQGPRGPAGTVGLPGNMVRSVFKSLQAYHVKRWTYPTMYELYYLKNS